jgi:hypothetical protein
MRGVIASAVVVFAIAASAPVSASWGAAIGNAIPVVTNGAQLISGWSWQRTLNGRPMSSHALIVGLGAVGTLAAPAGAVGGPSISVSPGLVHAGEVVHIYGAVPGCLAGNQVTLISKAFSAVHEFAGVPAVFAAVGTDGTYSVWTQIPASRQPGTYQITGRCGGGNLGVTASLQVLRAGASSCQVPGTNRHHTFDVNLDRDRDRERIVVFNSMSGPTPKTGFIVCDRVGDSVVRVQLKYTFTSPGSPDSGLRQAWVGDFNRDGRYEIAIRDIITPSAGELLTILRQSGWHKRTFVGLQTIAGDSVALNPSAHGSATVSVSLKATHTSDGYEHTERWTWEIRRQRWVCSSQCGFR